MANMCGIGVLLLFVQWCAAAHLGEPGLIFLPDPYGWLLLSKLVLYMLIVINGALISAAICLSKALAGALTLLGLVRHCT